MTQSTTTPEQGRLEMSPPGLSGIRPVDAWHLLPWVLAIAFYYFAPSGFHGLGAQVLIAILFALSLDLALGYAGIVTLGHAAFYGIGAYCAGVMITRLTPDPVAGLLLATALAGIIGVLTGMLILHTQGVAMFMLTLAIASMFYEVANQWRSVTGGDDGLSVPRPGPIFAWLGFEGFRFDFARRTAYLYCLGVLFVWFLISWRIVKSPFGRSLDGIRQNPRRMRAIGTPVWWRLVAMYGIACAMAGTAGALEGQTAGSVSLSVLGLEKSGIVAIMLVLGGERRLYGAFLGATFYVLIHDWAAAVNPFYWMFVVGAMLVAVVLFLDGGLMGLLDRVTALATGKRKGAASETNAGGAK